MENSDICQLNAEEFLNIPLVATVETTFNLANSYILFIYKHCTQLLYRVSCYNIHVVHKWG